METRYMISTSNSTWVETGVILPLLLKSVAGSIYKHGLLI